MLKKQVIKLYIYIYIRVVDYMLRNPNNTEHRKNRANYFKLIKMIDNNEEKFVGEGAYGCVLKPAKSCKNKEQYIKNTVAKLFTYKDEWEIENTNNDIIEKIFKNHKYLLLKRISSCKVTNIDSLYKYENYIKCDSIEPYNIKDLYQIVYSYGGKDLHYIKDMISFRDLYKSMYNIFNTIYILNSKGYSHQDIRMPNILYNYKTKKTKIIDYGLLINYNEKIGDKNDFMYNKPSYVLPPEYNVGNKKALDHHIYNYIINNSKKIYYNKYVRTNINKIITYINESDYNINEDIPINFSKTDSYMVGVLLYEFLVYYTISNKTNLTSKQFKAIFNFIKKLINPNIKYRLKGSQILIEYNKTLSIFK
mgnify:FL=1